MNIATKYNIGQKLWILVSKSFKFQARKVTITSIRAEVTGSWDGGSQKETTCIWYYFDLEGVTTGVTESQNLLFETKEQLAKSIIES